MRLVESAMGLFASVILVACGGDGSGSGDDSAGASNTGGAASGGAGAHGGSAGSSAKATGGASSSGGAGGNAGKGGSNATGGSGGKATGGSANGGGTSGPPLSCDDLSATGMWEDITPTTSRGIDGTVYNSQALVLDPFSPGVVWLGTARPDQAMSDSRSGLFKSTDCGSSWAHVNSGRSADMLNSSSLWSMAVDAVDQGVMYVVGAAGALGMFKSTNAGVDWDQLFTSGTEVATHVQYNFIGAVMTDATDHAHLVVTSHGSCSAPYGSDGSACQAETTDSGATWTVVANPNGLGFQENAGAYIIGDDNWIYATPAESTYRTTDHGASWNVVGPSIQGGESGHHPLVAASDGNYYLPSDAGVVRSTDQGASWSVLPNSGHGYGFTLGGDHLYTCPEFNLNYQTAALSDLSTWTTLPNPVSRADNRGAAFMDYDEAHHILYTSNFQGGLFRMVTP